MREIRFRVWDGRAMQYDGLDVSVALLGGVKNLMQYTGLKDGNGRYIYDGDILDKECKGEVVYFKGAFYYEFSKPSKSLLWCFLDDRLSAKIPVEIIGNRHEKPQSG